MVRALNDGRLPPSWTGVLLTSSYLAAPTSGYSAKSSSRRHTGAGLVGNQTPLKSEPGILGCASWLQRGL